MEANVARWLMQVHPELKVKYEPFTFKLYDKQVQWYKPDFEITYGNRTWFIEVKGYMDDLSRRKIQKFREQYPYYPLFIYDLCFYRYLKAKYSSQIEGWE